ncbi:TetR/AcrR family transcriptional regulator [Robinsoniella peoriensis]|uniref:TetR/AcrR family transcriptional regulator n=1 Tax=Robinsoniella peoriensis TaxID=180332 RepID=UPI0005C7DDB8|nr:TetR/AcrR family transcriptional regulator [Robinsoniella peoriensis]
MNEMFFRLPEEKQQRIINAGIEVFSNHEYKRASTDEIARKAGISKGLLFHYFHNKKSFYLYLLEYTVSLVKNYIMDMHFEDITDFFELLHYMAQKKAVILAKTPHIMNFFIKTYYSQNETVSGEVQDKMQSQIDTSFEKYLKNIDLGRFKEEIDPKEIYHMLIWMTEGYMYEKERVSETVLIPELMNHYTIWSDLLKKVSYKEEFL